MDRLDEHASARGDDDPDFGPGAERARAARPRESQPAATRAGRACPPARPRSPTTTRCSRRRSSAPKVVKGISLDDIAGYVNETALFRNQWQFRPEQGRRPTETDDEFKARIRPILREQLAEAKADGLLVPQVVYGYFAGQRRRRRPRRLDRRVAHHRAGPVPLPAPAARSRSSASPTSSGPSTRARPTTPRSTSSRWARRCQRARPPSCSPTTSTRTTCCCTASASRWPRRWPSTGTAASARSGASPTRTARRSPGCSASSTAAAATRGATRPARTSRTTRRSADLLDAGAHRHRGAPRRPASSTSRSRPPRRIICHHPAGQVLRRPLRRHSPLRESDV